MRRKTQIDDRQTFHVEAAPAEESPDAVRRAEAAQRRGDWPGASALWREAAETCGDDVVRARYLQLAAWCDDMHAICQEGGIR